jgi:hypothetical protein
MTSKILNALAIGVVLCGFSTVGRADDVRPMLSETPGGGNVSLAGNGTVADEYVDAHDATVTHIAAKLLSDDIERVTGAKPVVKDDAAALGKTAVIIGTIGKSEVIDQLIESGRLDISQVRGKWESSILVTIDHPLPNVERALVIAGSDRRGTAYGVFELSEQIGVSPWYWWADVTPSHLDALTIKAGTYIIGPPSVKYRGIFINDEDWSLQPWAAKTFDPKFGNIGPKTYEKVFELLLRLKANYLWPAMHPVSTEFGKIDANIKLADDWAIVMGASHAEPMNRNNVAWNIAQQGPWRYDTNRDAIFHFWEEWAQKRGPYEATWTLGLRGIHDSPMNGPKDTAGRVKLLQKAIDNQRDILAKYVNPNVESIPQIFVPYKEVLPLYQNGLKVPPDVTLVWPDDNFGYIRQLSTLEEQKRPGGAGVYYHLSYYGKPEDYLWLCSTPPALVWEEMSKAYDNGARTLWVVNVRGIKPQEIGMSFFLRLARNVKAWDESCQLKILTDWAASSFGQAHAAEIGAVMDEYYRLNYVVKPEHLDAVHFTNNYNESADRLARFSRLVERANAVYADLPSNLKDAFYETILYSVRCSALMNEKFLSDTADKAMRAYDQIQIETKYFNEQVAGGKWRDIMSADPRKQRVFEKPDPSRTKIAPATSAEADSGGYVSIDAAHPTRQFAQDGTNWKVIEGLGRSGDSIALLPTQTSVTGASKLEYDFMAAHDAAAKVMVYCIPTHAVHVGDELRYAASIDGDAGSTVDIDTKEFSPAWSENVLRAAAIGTSDHKLAAGKHTLTIHPLDPGMVFDKIVIDLGGLKPSYLGPPESAVGGGGERR